MAKLVIAPSAQQDLSDIYDYIARDKPIAAANWVEKIEGKCKLIATTPEFGERRPEYGADVRSSVVGRYVICLLYTSPSPRDLSTSRMPSSA